MRLTTRGVGNERGADFLITVTQPPEVSDDAFESLLGSLETELATRKKILESGTART